MDSDSIQSEDSGRDADTVSLDALSQEDLEHVARNPRYREMLADLLAPYCEESAGNISLPNPGRGTDTTRLTAQESQEAGFSGGLDKTTGSASGSGSDKPGPSTMILGKRGHRVQPDTVSKRPRFEQEDCSLFNPSLERDDKDEFRFEPPKVIEQYIETHFRKSLSKEERTAMLKRHPKPNTKAALPPKLDQFLVDFSGKKLDKARDAQLSRIQASVLYVANPLTNLWAELLGQDLVGDPQAVIPVADILEFIQRTLVLLGNANNQISEARRENALECVHPSLRKYGKCEFKDAEGDLFGDSFKEVLVKKVEADSALSKAVHIVTRSASVKTYQNPKGRWRGNSQFIPRGRTVQYGDGSGRSHHPYQQPSYSYRGKGKYPLRRQYTKRGSVFNRLSPESKQPRETDLHD